MGNGRCEVFENIRRFSGMGRSAILQRIDVLDREWNVERVLEVNASSLALPWLVLGLTVNRKCCEPVEHSPQG